MRDVNAQLVTPSEWPTMTFDQLMTQKSLMLDRYFYFSGKGQSAAASKIEEGIQAIERIINKN